jgi:hypothetical protein
VNANTNVSAEQLAEEVRAAQAAASATPQPGYRSRLPGPPPAKRGMTDR